MAFMSVDSRHGVGWLDGQRVVVVGELARARIVDGVVESIRFHIATMGRGPLTTISLGSAGDPAAP